ncbi:MAG: hypothetical protein WCR30_04010 [Clostridia bacterium]
MNEFLSSKFCEVKDELTGEIVIKEKSENSSLQNDENEVDIPAVPKNKEDKSILMPKNPPRAPIFDDMTDFPLPNQPTLDIPLPNLPHHPFPFPNPPIIPIPLPPNPPRPPFPPQPNPPRPPFPPFPPSPFPPPPQPFPPLPPYPPPQGQNAINLSRRLSEDLRTLEDYYIQLLAKAQTPRERQTIQDLQEQTRILAFTAGQIYTELSGNRPPILFPKNTIPRNFRPAVEYIYTFIVDIMNLITRLQRQVNVSSIDRQLVIMNTTLSTQLATLNTLIPRNIRM